MRQRGPSLTHEIKLMIRDLILEGVSPNDIAAKLPYPFTNRVSIRTMERAIVSLNVPSIDLSVFSLSRLKAQALTSEKNIEEARTLVNKFGLAQKHVAAIMRLSALETNRLYAAAGLAPKTKEQTKAASACYVRYLRDHPGVISRLRPDQIPKGLTTKPRY